MKRHHIIILVLLLIVFLAWLLWRNSHATSRSSDQMAPQAVAQSASDPTSGTTSAVTNATQSSPFPKLDPARQDERRKSGIAAMVRAFSASITFYGKVVDENGNPISAAAVHYSAADKPWKDGSKYEGSSDANGLFSLSGVKGASLYVTVWKRGYYPIENLSGGSFAYGVPASAGVDHPIPTKDNPAIFVLRKMGVTVPLYFLSSRQIKLPKNGEPVSINLQTGKTSSDGDIVLECWTQNQGLDPNKAQHYDWKFRLTVPGGGLVERKDQFAFEAPTEGYQQALEFMMPKNDERWSDAFGSEYFLSLAGGRYARIKLEMITGGAHFAVVESYLNPTPGDRNLEFDAARQIKAK